MPEGYQTWPYITSCPRHRKRKEGGIINGALKEGPYVTSEEAINNLGSLKFSQSYRMPDPEDKSGLTDMEV